MKLSSLRFIVFKFGCGRRNTSSLLKSKKLVRFICREKLFYFTLEIKLKKKNRIEEKNDSHQIKLKKSNNISICYRSTHLTGTLLNLYFLSSALLFLNQFYLYLTRFFFLCK
ncbi:hypothetical protein AQUCO_01000649v1 [Aquilegia coerulea]|uniref:Uncharacterized protein n=1 Tax=Aquilegia coerulea TaxID=218851 RepID=A0A2G5EAY3_AQUCA|nr:hypothetical protein AQUCO_01000649v1 [Aquilegia coerulea]